MAVADVPSVPADEHVYVGWVAAIADLDAPSLGTDLSSPTDLSCWFPPDGWSPGLSETPATDPRMCSSQVFERVGRNTRTLDVIYIDQTNAEGSPPNTAKTTLVPGTEGFFIVRRGLRFDAALDVSQTIEIIPSQAGKYNNLPPEQNSVLKIGQKIFITGPVVESEIVA